jgi:hypothetical protein
MVNNKLYLGSLVLYLALATSASILQATYIYPLDIFTTEDTYSDDLELYIVVTDAGSGQVYFTFHNDSLIDSSIARIYFEDDLFLNFASITDGNGTSFSQIASPGDLPGGNLLVPPFISTEEFSFNGGPPAPHNGINPDEWLRITFDITAGSFTDVLDGLNTGSLRIGAHVIALPHNSSESAVTVPEPATVALLALSALTLLRKKQAITNGKF